MKLKLSTKLFGIVAALALIGAGVAGSGIWYLHSLGEELTTATEKTAVKLDYGNAAIGRVWEMVAADREMFVAASIKDNAALEARAQQWDSAFKWINIDIAKVQPLLVSEQNKKDLATLSAAVVDFQKLSAEYQRLCRENKLDQVAVLVPQVQAFGSTASEALTDVKNMQRTFLAESQVRAASLRSQSLTAAIVMTCLLLVVVVAAAFVVLGINRTLVTSIDELSDGADQVAAAASQVSSSSQSLAQGSSEQAASLEETSASSEEIHSMARRNSANSRDAAELVTQSQEKFVHTNRSLDQMVVAMNDINTQSGKISKIIKVIDEIAFQTNILALNAAVEAARAGEAGMGFAVVADEVRNLAQRCAQAAKDTAELIEESIAKSNSGQTTVDQVATAIRTITAESAKVKTLVDEVNLGSDEQARGIDQIGKAITQMEQVTQKTAANAEESASAAEQLTAQSETVKEIVARLTEMVCGGETAVRTTVRRRTSFDRRPADSGASLKSLGKVTARRTRPAERAEPALAGRGGGKDPFPMDEQFKEF